MKEVEEIKIGAPPTDHLANTKREKERREAGSKKNTQKDELFGSSSHSNSD